MAAEIFIVSIMEILVNVYVMLWSFSLFLTFQLCLVLKVFTLSIYLIVTVLRMELDMQKFLQNSDMQQFEFPHFPTSYLRLAAHRVAQHYGLQTMVQDNAVDVQGIRILVLKKPESKFPAVCLSDVPAKKSENDKLYQMKVVIRARPKSSSNDANELGNKRSPVRSVEERKEEYDRARARIFSSPGSPESENALSRVPSEGRNLYVNDDEVSINIGMDGGSSSRIAILRDREKDRFDPDYDRSYDRYVLRNSVLSK